MCSVDIGAGLQDEEAGCDEEGDVYHGGLEDCDGGEVEAGCGCEDDQ